MTGEFCIAVHALVYLNHKATTISSEELAENICTNPARVRKVMAKLKKYELVITKEGIDGGYLFNLNPSLVTLDKICKALDILLVSSSWKSGNSEKECLISSGMADVMEGMYNKLDALCKQYLKNVTIADIDKIIFDKKNI